jgi:hypothetical protein
MTSDILTAPKELTDRSDRRTGPTVAELAAHKPQHGRGIVGPLVVAFDGAPMRAATSRALHSGRRAHPRRQRAVRR